MARLSTLDPESTSDAVKTLLDRVREETGMVPAILHVIANSTAALEGYFAMQSSLESGVLDRRLRLQIALTVSQANGSEYGVAAYSALGRAEGLGEEALRDARQANTPNRRADAALKFARALGDRPAKPLDGYLSRMRVVGFTDAEVAEIIAHAALVNLTDYFSRAAVVTADYPPVVLSEADE